MAREQKGHKWFAAIYDRLTAPAERSYMRTIREEIVGGAKGRVLELGAGTGASFPYYNDHAEQVIATEPDPYMLERARRRAEEVERPIEVRQASAEELPFDDASFDTVVSTLVMCSVSDPLRALSEVRRALVSGGRLALAVPCHGRLKNLVHALRGFERRHDPRHRRRAHWRDDQRLRRE
ncbi:hypothetical protein LCGC14_2321240, partial [marine sediment metagenome]